MQDKGQHNETRMSKAPEVGSRISDFVLDKVIFSNVFEKDIRRIYIYRKSERLAKALQLITPAFGTAPFLRNRLDGIAVGLIDAAILPPSSAREALSRELLALSSILSVARAGNLLSDMNADLITREAHALLQEIASYEEPRLFLEESLSLAELSKRAPDLRELSDSKKRASPQKKVLNKGQSKGHISDNSDLVQKIDTNTKESRDFTERQQAILELLRVKGSSYIKDISTMIREVSEKTIQRELQILVTKGVVEREGDRRWTRYSIR